MSDVGIDRESDFIEDFADDVAAEFSADETQEAVETEQVEEPEQHAEEVVDEQVTEVVETPEQKSAAAQEQQAQSVDVNDLIARQMSMYQDQLSSRLELQKAELAKQHKQELARLQRQMAAEKQRAMLVDQKKAKKGLLPDVYEWAGSGGDLETHKLLSTLASAAQDKSNPKVEQLERYVKNIAHQIKAERQQAVQKQRESDIESHMRKTVSEAASIHPRFKDDKWQNMLNGLVFVNGYREASAGRDPKAAMNAVNIAKEVDSLIKGAIESEIKSRASAIKQNKDKAGSPSKGAGTKPGKTKKKPKNTDEAIDDMFGDDMFS